MNSKDFGKLVFLLFIGSATVSCSTSTNEKIEATANETVDWVSRQFSDAGDWISKQYSELLDDDDQDMLTASTKKAAATGEDQVWTSDKGDVKASIKVIKTESEKGEITVQVPKDRLEGIPPLELTGAPFRVVKNANVRSGPGTNFAVIDKLNQATTVVVIGKVQNEPWYLVGDGNVANGFVFEKLLEPIPDSDSKKLAVAKITNNSDTLQEEKVETVFLCRTIQQTVILPDGSINAEEVRACQGLNGWEIK
jgi:uncharacterized protein YgiM (DUF1202 family)